MHFDSLALILAESVAEFAMLRCVSVVLAVAVAAASVSPALAADAAGPFMLHRIARTGDPGLHIRLVDASGAPVYPIDVMVEYDRGAPDRARASEDGLTLVSAGRTVRAVTIGEQRFPVESPQSNVMIFSR